MFHKLRMQLTIINVIIIAVLFLLLTIGTYLFAQSQMKDHAENMTHNLVSDIQSGIITDLPRHGGPPDHPPDPPTNQPPPLKPWVFFVKTDHSNRITFESATQPLESKDLLTLVQKTLDASETSGTITPQEVSYTYTKVPLQNQPGMLLVFQNFEHEQNLLRILITALIITGIICLLLSLLGSLFMANHAIIPLRKAWEQQQMFLADASHELRTPLAVIQTNLEIVLDNQTDTIASQSKWLHNIKEESDAMAKLVDSLLFLARADSHQQIMDKKTFYLSQAIIDSIESLSPLAISKEIQLDHKINPEINLYGDEWKIKQIIGILFDNAIRHTPPSGKISLRLYQSEKEILFTFSDTGEGMEPKHLDKIFDRFYQVDTSRAKGGSGLGLAIAKLIIKTHGGSIQVASTLHSGTEFTITFPIPYM